MIVIPKTAQEREELVQKMESEALAGIRNRMKMYQQYEHWTNEQCAFNIHVGRTTLTNLYGGSGSTATAVNALLFCQDLSAEWLIRGDGPMLKSQLDHPHPTTPYSVTRTYEPEPTPAPSASSTVADPLPVPDSAHFINVLINRIEQQAVEIASLTAKKTELEAQISAIKSGLNLDTKQ